MSGGCIHCGISADYIEQGYFYLYSQEQKDFPLNRNFEEAGDGIYYFTYNKLVELTDELMMIEDILIEEGWACSISAEAEPASLMPAGKFLNLMRYRQMVETIQTGEFTSHLQPIIDLKDYSLFGYESLLRAGNGTQRINPGELFHAASLTGFHSMLDQKARKSAIESRQDQVKPGIKSFINFLPSTIYNPEFCLRHTFKIVNELGVDPEDLVFEVVETEKIEDVDHLKSVLEVYKREGMKVALDDVGSGFATIDMLTLLKPDYVKIDRAFVSHCDTNEKNQEFLRQVMEIAGELDIKVLAEGIERKEELSFCKEIGVHYAQGYYIGKPAGTATMPFESPQLV